MLAATVLKPGDSVDKIASTLSAGGEVEFRAGTYNIGKTVLVGLNKTDLKVTATDANFVSDAVNGDLFRISGGGKSGTRKASVDWTGGTFDIRNQRLSTTRPFLGTKDSLRASESKAKITRRSGATVDKLGTKGTADAINVRGNERIKNLEIDRINVIGSNSNWRTAGGDSGVFVTDVDDITIQNSKFDGLRDAGIYISDSVKENTPRTKNVLLQNNLVQRSFDGITAKRGVDNVTFRNNALIGNEIGASLKINGDGSKAKEDFENVRFVGNFISNSGRAAYFFEDFEDVDLTNNDDKTFKSNDIFLSKARSSRFANKRAANIRERDRDELDLKRVKTDRGVSVSAQDIVSDSGNSIKNGFASQAQLDAERKRFRNDGGFA